MRFCERARALHACKSRLARSCTVWWTLARFCTCKSVQDVCKSPNRYFIFNFLLYYAVQKSCKSIKALARKYCTVLSVQEGLLHAFLHASRFQCIVHVNFCVFQFRKLLLSMPDAPRSETLVAGLRSVLAILQPEAMTVCRL